VLSNRGAFFYGYTGGKKSSTGFAAGIDFCLFWGGGNNRWQIVATANGLLIDHCLTLRI
jgi:hypothetical protein